MDALVAFAAALVTLRLTALLVLRWRVRRAPELVAWAAALGAFSVASAALAWAAAAGWSGPAFRAYYLFGGLLTAPLLGVGSLLLAGRRWAAPAGLLYAGLSVGLVLAAPLTKPVGGAAIPHAGDHLELVPVRLAAILGNSAGTLAVIAVALATIRRRPLGNALIVAGVAVAAAGSALFGLGVAQAAGSLLVAALLLYAGFVARPAGVGAASARPDRDRRSRDHHRWAELDEEPDGASVGQESHGPNLTDAAKSPNP